jgi:hypothetical protein
VTVDEWVNTNQHGAARLAQALSLATTIEPELLRAARLRLCPDLGVAAESLVWFSPLVMSRAINGVVFSSEALHALWRGLQGKKELLREMQSLTNEYHQGLPPPLQWEEEVVYLALGDEPDAAAKIREKLRTIVATLREADSGHMVYWAERALPRLPENVQAEGVFRLAAQAAFERGAPLQELSGTGGPTWLKPVADDDKIGVRLLTRGIEFSHPPSSSSTAATVPKGDPMKLLLSDNETFQSSPGIVREVSLSAYTKVTERLAIGSALYVRPVGGRTFVVEPKVEGDTRPTIAIASEVSSLELQNYLLSHLQPEFDVALASSDRASFADRDVLLLAGWPTNESPFQAMARAECKRIIYALPSSTVNYPIDSKQVVVDFTQPDRKASLAELKLLLRGSQPKVARLFDVPPLPDPYVDTPEPFERAREILLSPAERVLLLSGGTGSGCSTLAAALARDCQVRRRFPGGIFWRYAGSGGVERVPDGLFIIDYEVPGDSHLVGSTDGPFLLFTKQTEYEYRQTAVQVPPWTEPQIQRRFSVPTKWIGFNAGNPLACQALAAVSRVHGMQVSFSSDGPTTILTALAQHYLGAAADVLRKLAVLVPDAKVPPALYERLLVGTDPALLTLLRDAGYIQLLADRSMIVRGINREIFGREAGSQE